MKTVWTKGLTGQPREEIEREFKASAHIRGRLTKILQEKIDTKRTQKVSEEEYALPAWPYKQADSIGYERAMREIISLLSDNGLKNE